MDFRRNADRRRRVLRDDLSGSGTTTVEMKVQRVGRYDGRRTLQRQPKLIDLIPTSGWTVWPICLGAVGICVSLIILNANLPSSGTEVSEKSVLANSQLFQLSAPGSIAGTFLTSFTALSALLCFQIYFVRRHRQDDYLGQYQIWRWLACFFVCMTIGNLPWFKPLVSQSFQSVTPDVYHSFTTKLLLGSGLFLMLGVGFRTFLEVKESICSTFCIMTATVLSALSILLLPELETGIHQIPAIGNLPTETVFGLWFLGSVGYFCGFTFYLSYVHKDVQGKLESSRARKSRGEALLEPEADTEKKQKVSTPKTVRQNNTKAKESSLSKSPAAKKPSQKTASSFEELAASLEPEQSSSSDSHSPAKKTRRRKKAA